MQSYKLQVTSYKWQVLKRCQHSEVDTRNSLFSDKLFLRKYHAAFGGTTQHENRSSLGPPFNSPPQSGGEAGLVLFSPGNRGGGLLVFPPAERGGESIRNAIFKGMTNFNLLLVTCHLLLVTCNLSLVTCNFQFVLYPTILRHRSVCSTYPDVSNRPVRRWVIIIPAQEGNNALTLS